MAEVTLIKFVKLILMSSCLFNPFSLDQSNFTCTLQIQRCFNALSSSIVYDTEFRVVANNYFDQWSSTSKFSTGFEDLLESLDEEPALPDPNYINIAIDTVFKAVYKPSLGFPYQYIDVDMESVAKTGTEKHSITQQPINSTDDILKKTRCKTDKLTDVNSRIIFGSQGEIIYVNVFVSDYFHNNKYGCVEFSMIPSRMPEVMANKKNFDAYYLRVTCFINLKSMEIGFYNFGSELCFYGPYLITDTLATFKSFE